MNLKIKTFIIFIGDVVILYGSLIIALFLRRGFTLTINFPNYLRLHLIPFSFFFIIWVLIFYLANLYDPRNFKNRLEFFKNFSVALIINGFAGILFFYLFSVGGITPKTNLLLFLIVFAILGTLWRYIFNYLGGAIGTPEKILIIQSDSQNKLSEELIEYLKKNRQLGYQISHVVDVEDKNNSAKNITNIIKNEQIDLVVIPTHLEEKAKLASLIYERLSLGIKVMNFAEFYELIFKKIPLSELEEAWFLENLVHRSKIYETIKGGFETILALILIVALSLIFILLAIGVKLSSKGPAIFQQKRVGKNGEEFILYKFRSMKESDQHGWQKEDYNRITPFGKIIRKTHLDELPQLFNVLKGNVSFVGPRPDFIKFFENLNTQIPYYNIRTLVKPGITGWAQINFPITVSPEQTKERLSYDFYYIKNYSLFLDLIILLKTIKLFFTASGI